MSQKDEFHVFNLHSHIMYLVAKAVIRSRGLDPSRCAFITTRGYRTPDDGEDGIARYPFPFPNWDLSFYYGKDHRSIRSNIGKIEKFVDTITGGTKFHYYAQHTCSYYVNIIASYEKCIDYSFLEEGIAAYVGAERLVKLTMGRTPPKGDSDMIASSGSRLREFDQRFYNVSHPKFGFAYGVSPDSFPTAPKEKRIRLEDVFHAVELDESEKGDAILILGNERWAQLPKPLRHAKFEKMLNWFVRNVLVAKGYKRVLYKLRNDTFQSDVQVFKRVFTENPQVEFVPIGDAHVLENVIKTLDVPVYVIASACGEYARQMGRDVYSLAKLYCDFDPGYAKTEHWFCVERLEASGAKFVRYDPSVPIQKPSDRTVYSFDIFDTLLTRKVATPGGIFAIVQDRIRKECREDYSAEMIENFCFFRRAVEHVRYGKLGEGETSLEDVYRDLHALFKNLPWEKLEKIMQMEIETEIEYTIPIRENIREVRRLLKMGERVILISDMYLPEDVIRKILDRADPILRKCKLYLSSSIGLKKARSGKLFRYVCKAENILPKNLRHVGDNLSSDIKVPRAQGIQTRSFQGSMLHPVERAYMAEKSVSHQIMAGVSRHYRVRHPDASSLQIAGVLVAAPILYGYIEDVLRKAVAKGIKTLYFFARDGQIMLRIAKRINKANKWNLDLRYFYCSRQSILPASIFRVNVEIYEWVFAEYTNITFQNIAERLEVDAATLLSKFPSDVRNRIRNVEEKLNKDVIGLLKYHMSKDPAVRALIESNSKRLRGTVIAYFKQEGLFDNGTVGIVDIGWKGLVQNMFFKIAVSYKPDFKMVGFYFSSTTCHHGHSFASGRENYVENILPITNLRPGAMVNFMETMCCSDHGTTLGYQRGADGKVVPVLGDNSTRDLELVRDYHKAVEWWVREYLLLRKRIPDMVFSPKTILWKMMEQCSTPHRDVADAFGSLHFSGHQNDQHLHELAPALSVFGLLSYYSKSHKARNEITWWLAGSIARSSRTVQRLDMLMQTLAQIRRGLIQPVYRRVANLFSRGIRLTRGLMRLLAKPIVDPLRFIGRIFASPVVALSQKIALPVVIRCVYEQKASLKNAQNDLIGLEIRLADLQGRNLRIAETLKIVEEEMQSSDSTRPVIEFETPEENRHAA